MLKVEKLTKKYGDFEVLKGISFMVKEGTVYGFIGRNGAGKTTTMNILTGLIDFNSGNVSYNGIEYKKNSRNINTSIGYVPQNPVFYGYMNAYEYLRFIGNISGMSNKEINIHTEEVLNIVKLKEAAKRKVGTYSGGMKQRFAIAVSLFNNPKLLFLDEPTSALDPEGRMEILLLIKQLKEQGMTVFLSTHILNDAERVCDTLSILDKGQIILSENLKVLKDKFIKPIYDIETEQPTKELEYKLKSLSWVERTVSEGNKLSVFVKDIKTSKGELLLELIKANYTLVSYNMRKSDLEDIFIRLVNKDEDI